MSTKRGTDFHNDYPNGYSKNGTVYNGNGDKIGYQTGDGDYRINNDSSNNGTLYNNRK